MKNKFLLSICFFTIAIFSLAVNSFLLYSQSIRLDESQSIWIATKTVPAILRFTAGDVHVPLYGIILHFWIQLFGTDIIIVRTLSLLFFIVSLPVIYLFAKESSTKYIALLTVSLFCLSPFVMWFSSEARMYTLFVFVTSLNHLFFLRMIRSNGKKYKFEYFLSTVFGFYTHYFFIFLIITQGIFVLKEFILNIFREKNIDSNSLITIISKQKKLPLLFIGITVSALGFLIPWILYVFTLGSFSNAKPLLPSPTSYNIFQTFVNFIFGFQSQPIQTALVALWPLAVMILFFIFTRKKSVSLVNTDYFILVTFLPIILVFAISYFRAIFLSRYLILVVPTLFFIIAWEFANYPRRISFIMTSVFVISMFGLLIYQNTSEVTPVREDYRQVANYLGIYATPKDIIAVTAPFTIYPIEYSYEGKARISTIPEWNRYSEGSIPAFSENNLEEQIKRYKKQYAKIIVVFSYDQGYEVNIRKYFDLNYQLVGNKSFSPGLDVRSYKLRYDIEDESQKS